MERVSVAMAVCNGVMYLPVQFDSILGQLEEDDELVVSYDTSNDGTIELLRGYQLKDPRVKIVYNHNPGIAGNFSNALHHCAGDYIFISDQDDEWMPNKRERVLQAFRDSGADLVIHNGVHTNAELSPVSEPFFSTFRIGNGKIRNLIKSRYSGCCMAFTRRLRDRIIPIPPDMDAYDRWIGVLGEFTGKIAYVGDVLILHRLHGNNATHLNARSMLIIVKTRAHLLKHLVLRLIRERNAGK